MITREQVNAARSRLLSVLDGLSDEDLNWKPNETSWSIAQVVQHIAMIEGRTPTLISLGFAEDPNFTPSDLKLEQRVPDRTAKFNAPPPLHPSDEPKSFTELTAILERSHQTFVDAFKSIENDRRLDTTSPPMPHPVFGKMSTRQWIEAAHYHEVRHTQQIEEIKRLLKAR